MCLCLANGLSWIRLPDISTQKTFFVFGSAVSCVRGAGAQGRQTVASGRLASEAICNAPVRLTNSPVVIEDPHRHPAKPETRKVFRSFLGVYQFAVRLAPLFPKASTAARRGPLPSGFPILPWSLPIFRSPGTTLPKGRDRRKARPHPQGFSDPSLEFTNFPFAWHPSSQRPRPPQREAQSRAVFRSFRGIHQFSVRCPHCFNHLSSLFRQGARSVRKSGAASENQKTGKPSESWETRKPTENLKTRRRGSQGRTTVLENQGSFHDPSANQDGK